MRTSYRRWSQHPYQGEQSPPIGSAAPATWPMFFISRRSDGTFLDPFGQQIQWNIQHPLTINWEAELLFVEQTLRALTPQHIQSAQLWASEEVAARMNTLLLSLARSYSAGSPAVARMLGCMNAAINDTFVITWFLKYSWDVARPNQYGRNLPVVLATPRFPAYPSAHATAAGCAEVLLRYFFPQEGARIRGIVEEGARSRLYAGVHFQADNNEGLRLGRQVGGIVVRLLQTQQVSTFR